MVFRCVIGALCCGLIVAGQDAAPLKAVQTVFVGSLGDKPGADTLQKELALQLKNSHRFQVAANAAEADAILEGTGEVWVKERYTLNPRERISTNGARTIYSGYLSVQLQSKKDEPLWSYLAAPHSSTSGDVNRDLAKLIVKKLVEAADAGAGTKP